MKQPRPSIFGGSWWNDDNSGSRYAILDNWPDNSNENIGARGRSDQRYWRASANNRDRDCRARLLTEGQNAASGSAFASEQMLDIGQGHVGRPARFDADASKSRSVFRASPENRWSARLSRFGEYTPRFGRAGRSGVSPSRPAAGFFEGRL